MVDEETRAALDLCTNNAINYRISQRQLANGEPVTPELTNPSPAEIVRILNKRYVRADIDQICRRHAIETKKSISKASLVTALVVKFGADVLDESILLGDLD